MIHVQLYFRRKIKSLILNIDSYDHGIELLQYFVDDLLGECTAGFAFSLKNRAIVDFPTLHFQQCDKGCLLQIYVPDAVAVDGEEGWHCLVEWDGNRNTNPDELVKVAADDSDSGQNHPVRFAEGILFSNELLVSTEIVKTVLSQFAGQDCIRDWLRQGQWINLGLL